MTFVAGVAEKRTTETPRIGILGNIGSAQSRLSQSRRSIRQRKTITAGRVSSRVPPTTTATTAASASATTAAIATTPSATAAADAAEQQAQVLRKRQRAHQSLHGAGRLDRAPQFRFPSALRPQAAEGKSRRRLTS